MMRRQYVPPLMDVVQDFILAMKCPSKSVSAQMVQDLKKQAAADPFALVLLLARPSDESLEEDAQKATVVSERLFIILVLEEENEEQAKLDALHYDSEAYAWIHGVVKSLYNEHVLSSIEVLEDLEPLTVALKLLSHPGQGLPSLGSREREPRQLGTREARPRLEEMSLPPMPDAVLNSGTPEGTASTLTLTEDAWDLLGLGASDAMNDRDMHIKNGQVCLLTGGDYMNAKRRYALDNREAQRAQWRQQAEQRLAKADARRGGLDKAAAEGGVMKTAKFTWSKDGAKSFEWRKIYHALVGNVGPGEGGLLAEALITPTSMRMYTDHRVMGQVVLPGVSHVSLMAATASQGFPNPGGGLGDWHISVKEVLFERPYIVHSGAELIAAIANGVDPSTVQAMAGGLPIPMTPVGVPTTYCRATNVTKERGIVKSTLDWAK
ncbi:hypothetical protein AK812_SmicGene31997 [Symbiodinium microadriaticum]|uniref:Polyketide synthase dehydratase domain-containing protein n=2 Tax=Symbiodinium TaxID=2949 RepID=A0A1Q9CV96_SYMMI|nr:hypothetical protein AK812_SmicGene31997 [Symbiodinium microadriaticum]